MGTLHIKKLRLRAYIGFNDHETDKLQDVIISYKIDYDSHEAAISDNPALALDYKAINKNIIALVDEKRFKLLEALTHSIASVIMTYSQVKMTTVDVEKPNALRFTDNVIFTLTLTRDA
ncbi:MAG: dihydroneopterin aldolase [Marinilabiliaceae bacterium]|nr:dihydroneopterin aldolase [Marinilabiliaceae bacterium]